MFVQFFYYSASAKVPMTIVIIWLLVPFLSTFSSIGISFDRAENEFLTVVMYGDGFAKKMHKDLSRSSTAALLLCLGSKITFSVDEILIDISHIFSSRNMYKEILNI